MPPTDLAAAIAAGDLDAVPADALAEWATSQRWFSSKQNEVREFKVLDLIVLSTADPVVAIVIAEARFGTGTHDLYQLPIAVRGAASGWDQGVICERGDQVLYDALLDEAADRVLAEHLAASSEIDRPNGCLRFLWEAGAGAAGGAREARAMDAEQSNTSVVIDGRLVLKVFRRIQPGINPELEMLRFLAAHDFANIAPMLGWYAYSGELMDATLGVMQPYVRGARDGWELALEALLAGDAGFLERLGRLGAVTGRMHAVLASDSSDPDFAPEEPTDEMLSLLSATLDEQIERLFDDLPSDVPAIAPIAVRGEEVRDHLQSLSHVGVGGRLIRIHGDYHLAQAVRDGGGDWVVLDFEGEPGRSLIERRRKRSPLRDVAGMLRSFAYAASAVELLHGRRAPDGWEEEARQRFLGGYMAEVDQALLPAGANAVTKLLAIFELERAIYELRYELGNRPDWVGIPVACITRLLEAMPA
jgi:trehalose synthase-fused probable maltokinase